jgi:cytidylate kinase
MIIAIDGPAASGKTSVGRLVASQLGLPFVDSGLLYRAIAAYATHEGIADNDTVGFGDAAARAQIYIDGDFVSVDAIDFSAAIHDSAINRNLAAVSATPRVREQINPKLRAMAGNGVVMAGRDIGPVVFPETPYKFYITASLEVRMRRRGADFASRGQTLSAEALRREIGERDKIDTAADPEAEVISTDHSTQAQVAQHILASIASINRNAPSLS